MWKRVDTPCHDAFLIALLFVLSLIIGFACACCCPSAHGSWGPRGCGSVGSPVFVPQVVQYVTPLTWHYSSDWADTGKASLYRGSQLVGTYNYATGVYVPADGSSPHSPEGWPVWRTEMAKDGCQCKTCKGECSCGKGGKCCTDKDCKCCGSKHEAVVVAQVEQNFGLELDKIGGSGNRMTLHDGVLSREVTRDEAKRLLTKDGLGDDSNKPFYVVVCKDAKLRETISKDFLSGSASAWARENVRFQIYPDEQHHHLEGYKLDQDQRYQKSGLMIAVMTAPNKEGFGKRLYAQYDYEGGPERLNTEARRRIDPNWDPNPLPAPPKPPVPEPGLGVIALIGQLFAALPGWSWILASLGAAYFLWRGKK